MKKARLEEHYIKYAKKKLKEEFGYKNIMQIPYIEKIVLSMALKDAVQNSKVIDNALNDLMLITGQKPIVTTAKKSIAGFKLRQGMKIGCKVTLRRRIMFEFLDRLVNIALPRVRDFKGLNSKQFDKKGNYSMGIKEQIVFPEIDYDKTDVIRGMNIVIVTTANTDKEAKSLLKTFNLPFIN